MRAMATPLSLSPLGLSTVWLLATSDAHGSEVVANDNHMYYLLGALLIVQVLLLIVLIVEHRRYLRTRATAQKQHSEITHAARLALAGEISASIVHEVTQPLSAILSNVETAETLLRKPSPDLESILEILEDVRKDDLRAHGIVRKLRILLRKRELQFEHVDINALTS